MLKKYRGLKYDTAEVERMPKALIKLLVNNRLDP
jgi:hypothetical protein